MPGGLGPLIGILLRGREPARNEKREGERVGGCRRQGHPKSLDPEGSSVRISSGYFPLWLTLLLGAARQVLWQNVWQVPEAAVG